jgi:hypothetical protein
LLAGLTGIILTTTKKIGNSWSINTRRGQADFSANPGLPYPPKKIHLNNLDFGALLEKK